jgi:hypothetical protein
MQLNTTYGVSRNSQEALCASTASFWNNNLAIRDKAEANPARLVLQPGTAAVYPADERREEYREQGLEQLRSDEA